MLSLQAWLIRFDYNLNAQEPSHVVGNLRLGDITDNVDSFKS